MNNRIKELRTTLGLSQDEFGKRIGLSKSGISNIESGLRNVTEKHIKLICSELSVSENWLRTGEGEMFIELTPEDEYMKAATELSIDNDQFAMNALVEYWKLDAESKKLFQDFLYKLFKNTKE